MRYASISGSSDLASRGAESLPVVVWVLTAFETIEEVSENFSDVELNCTEKN